MLIVTTPGQGVLFQTALAYELALAKVNSAGQDAPAVWSEATKRKSPPFRRALSALA